MLSQASRRYLTSLSEWVKCEPGTTRQGSMGRLLTIVSSDRLLTLLLPPLCLTLLGNHQACDDNTLFSSYSAISQDVEAEGEAETGSNQTAFQNPILNRHTNKSAARLSSGCPGRHVHLLTLRDSLYSTSHIHAHPSPPASMPSMTVFLQCLTGFSTSGKPYEIVIVNLGVRGVGTMGLAGAVAVCIGHATAICSGCPLRWERSRDSVFKHGCLGR